MAVERMTCLIPSEEAGNRVLFKLGLRQRPAATPFRDGPDDMPGLHSL
jgi:hypothetical protein